MNESEVTKKLGDVISLLQLLETVINRFPDDRKQGSSRGAGEIPWAGVKITIGSAKRILEEVCLNSVVCENTEFSSRQSCTEPQTNLSFRRDFFEQDSQDLGFTAPVSLASRIRPVPRVSDQTQDPLLREDLFKVRDVNPHPQQQGSTNPQQHILPTQDDE